MERRVISVKIGSEFPREPENVFVIKPAVLLRTERENLCKSMFRQIRVFHKKSSCPIRQATLRVVSEANIERTANKGVRGYYAPHRLHHVFCLIKPEACVTVVLPCVNYVKLTANEKRTDRIFQFLSDVPAILKILAADIQSLLEVFGIGIHILAEDRQLIKSFNDSPKICKIIRDKINQAIGDADRLQPASLCRPAISY